MPVPYCLDDCGFVVEPEVRQVDSSSTILLKIALAIQGFLYFHRVLDAWGWCTGTTQKDGTGKEEGGGFRMGNTCIPMVDSC